MKISPVSQVPLSDLPARREAFTDTPPPGHNVDRATWPDIEVNIGIICASLPAIKPVASRLFPRLLSSNRSKPIGPSHNHTSSLFKSGHRARIRLKDVDSTHKTVTRVEAVERTIEERESGDGKGIFVTMSTRQDVENKREETGSEKNLIFQR